MTELMKLEGLALETLAEFANEAGEQAEKHAKGAVQFALQAGRALQAAKDQVPHGEWLAWLGANWDYHQMTASRYMRLANYTCVFNLKSAESINEALRIVAEDPDTPKQTRTPKASVEVIEPGQPSVQPDDDPTPDPPSIRKTAKGSQKRSEDKKPKTAAVTPEILPARMEDLGIDSKPEHWNPITLADYSDDELLDTIDSRAAEPKKTAKKYRKRADALDPPDTAKAPTLPQLINAIPDDWNPDLINAASDWCRYKASRPKAERYSSLRGWQITLKHMAEGKPKDVIAKIEKAISNNWKGWNHGDEQNGKSRTALTGDDW